MTAPSASLHDPHAQRRAQQALRCLPFRRGLYRELEQAALSSSQLAARSDWQSLTRSHLSANQAEDHLIWLIQLGVLRREVDGQGLTERMRLTPLGREVLETWSETIPPASPLTRLKHWLSRHRPRLL